MDLKGGTDGIQLVQCMVQRRGFVNTVMNLWAS